MDITKNRPSNYKLMRRKNIDWRLIVGCLQIWQNAQRYSIYNTMNIRRVLAIDTASFGCGPGPARRCTETVNDKRQRNLLLFD